MSLTSVRDRRVMATLLAGLRLLQEEVYSEGGTEAVKNRMPHHFSGIAPLEEREVDQLCADLNMGDLTELAYIRQIARLKLTSEAKEGVVLENDDAMDSLIGEARRLTGEMPDLDFDEEEDEEG